MSALTIRQLHLAARRDAHWAARIVLERALSGAVIEDRRLVLVRRGPALSIAPAGVGPAARPARESALTRQFSDALRPVLASAVHGASRDARQAGAVWFADRHEALACYLALLARGVRPTGWFWKAALPAGFEAERPDAAVRRLAGQLPEGGATGPLAARVMREAARRAGLDTLLALFGGVHLPEAWRPVAIIGPFREDAAEPAERAMSRDAGDAAQGPPIFSLAQALARCPEYVAPLRGIDPVRQTERLMICLAILFGQARPDLAARPDALRTATLQWAARLVCERTWHAPAEPVAASHGPRATLDAGGSLRNRVDAASPAVLAARADHTGSEVPRSAEAGPRELSAPDRQELAALLTAQPFPGAGLCLVIPALVRLGFPEWLEARFSLVAQDTARKVLVDLFAQHAPQGLPVAALLLTGTPRLPCGPPTREVHEACRTWRKGLDGWLRRQAGCRLHDLAARAGWLHQGLERSVAAFPLGAIHMGLRRRALDVDPGWTPWLGISLRYIFAERPDDPALPA